MVDAGSGPVFSKEDGRKLWANNGMNLDETCLCVECPCEETCDWRYDLYNMKPGEPEWDCLGAKWKQEEW